ncbi:glycine zipper family protein [Alcanivorax sp. ST75FaO-1]|nr:glycine zipper family protein [Alcanivorax sp.]MBF1800767.1 glycine zipper family protein [Alloalcanivorax profundimaris]MBM1143315.1 glycine zipper family protein [Alcanivorax sp. ZXX171]MAY11308.1 glycine zipper family protein [Alcanivorax sp.]MBI56571.1 glycine zipper family protein [Alcanivorax sp.]
MRPTLIRTAAIGLSALLLAACASTDRVIVDKQNVDEAQYQQDLSDCRAIADQVGTGRDAAEGAVGGALIGGVLGAIFGNSGTAGRMAGGGAVVGAAGKAGDAQQEKEQVLKNCMRGRGYRVLN